MLGQCPALLGHPMAYINGSDQPSVVQHPSLQLCSTALQSPPQLPFHCAPESPPQPTTSGRGASRRPPARRVRSGAGGRRRARRAPPATFHRAHGAAAAAAPGGPRLPHGWRPGRGGGRPATRRTTGAGRPPAPESPARARADWERGRRRPPGWGEHLKQWHV